MRQPKYAIFSFALAVAAFIFVASLAVAQDVTHPSTTKTTGPSVHEVQQTRVQNAEVIHVSGNEVVLELANGSFELLRVPAGFKFDVDGKQLSAGELTPGTRLTQEIHTVSTPQEVTTLRTVNGKVWHISPPHVILSFPEGKNKSYTVPEDIVFNIDGQEKTVFDLRKGMEITATVVTVQPQHVVSTHTVVAGQAPPNVPFEGPLLIEPLVTSPEPEVTAKAEQPAPSELPTTASFLPLTGMLGFVFLAFYAGVRIASRHVSKAR